MHIFQRILFAGVLIAIGILGIQHQKILLDLLQKIRPGAEWKHWYTYLCVIIGMGFCIGGGLYFLKPKKKYWMLAIFVNFVIAVFLALGYLISYFITNAVG